MYLKFEFSLRSPFKDSHKDTCSSQAYYRLVKQFQVWIKSVTDMFYSDFKRHLK